MGLVFKVVDDKCVWTGRCQGGREGCFPKRGSRFSIRGAGFRPADLQLRVQGFKVWVRGGFGGSIRKVST